MSENEAKELLDKVVGAVFGYQNPLSLEDARQKFAFDLRLPQQVYDCKTNEPVWASSANPTRFISPATKEQMDQETGWMLPKEPIQNVQDILRIWQKTNYTCAERSINSTNIAKSDSIINSENVYMSVDIRNSKNVLFSEGGDSLENVVGVSRCGAISNSIRVEDSGLCVNSFSVVWSQKVSNSYFIQDCYDVMDCMFCSHINGKQYCIANIQYTEEEYKQIKQQVVHWILAS